MAKDLEYVNPDDIIIVGLDTDDGLEHPLYDESCMLEVDDTFIQSILAEGVLEPVIVRKEAGKFYCTDGRQRVKAAREARKRSTQVGDYEVRVPVMEQSGGDDRMARIVIAANSFRHEDTILQKANKAQRLLARLGNIDDVVLSFGKSITTIKNWLSLDEADPAIHEAIKTEKISSQAGIELSKLPRDQQKAQLEDILRGSTKRVSEAKAKAVRREVMGSTASDPNSPLAAPGNDKEEGDGLPPEVDEGVSKPAPKPRKTTGEGRAAIQRGVKRTWVRSALETATGRALKDSEPEKWAVLQWFAWGDVPKDIWFDKFISDVEAELGASADE